MFGNLKDQLDRSPFISFIRSEYRGESLRKTLIIAIISGLANGLILLVINSVPEITEEQEGNFSQLLFFAACITLFLVTKRHILFQASLIIESALKQVRVRISNKLRFSDLRRSKTEGSSAIFSRLTQETNQISTAATVIINAMQSTVMLVFSLFYLLWLSPLAFVTIVVAIVLAAMVYEKKRKIILEALKVSNAKDLEFLGMVDGLLKGFKEMKVNRKKSNSLFSALKNIATETTDQKVKAARTESVNFIFSQTFFYSLIGIILFVLPAVVDIGSNDLIKIIASILFIMGPVSAVIIVVPLISRVNIAIENLRNLEARFDAKIPPDIRDAINNDLQPVVDSPAVSFCNRMAVENLMFKFGENGNGFELGPVSEFECRKGTITFIEGGNGSGKSTFLKVLTGLYTPLDGKLLVDEQEIQSADLPSFRELFSVVFTDFHLMNRLFGYEDTGKALVDELLLKTELNKKTGYSDGLFSNVNLSTGQRKRLALVVSIIENKDVFIFDEVAADQDPEFKKYFYHSLLPQLKAQGKTVIAVTHDDNYFNCCDVKFKMRNGRFIDKCTYDNGELTGQVKFGLS